jgi:hypothetical protein
MILDKTTPSVQIKNFYSQLQMCFCALIFHHTKQVMSSASVLATVNNVDVCAYFLPIFLLHKMYYFNLHIQKVLALPFHGQNWG